MGFACDERADLVGGGIRFHIEVESGIGERLKDVGEHRETASRRHDVGELSGPYVSDAAGIAGDAAKVIVVEEDDVAVRGQVAVRLEIERPRRPARREGGDRVLGDVLGIGRHETAVGEDAGGRLTEEPRVGHDVGVVPSAGFGFEACASEPPKAVLNELRAFVNSLGMIQSLFEELSLIFGSICRYW